jgi:hypothetical protein
MEKRSWTTWLMGVDVLRRRRLRLPCENEWVNVHLEARLHVTFIQQCIAGDLTTMERYTTRDRQFYHAVIFYL